MLESQETFRNETISHLRKSKKKKRDLILIHTTSWMDLKRLTLSRKKFNLKQLHTTGFHVYNILNMILQTENILVVARH